MGLVSLVGQAVSYNFGALLGGTSVRYRFYSAWGFSLAEIVRLVLMLAVTFWVGALGLCGVVFLLAPPVIPDELLAKMPIHDVRFLGGILLAIALSYLVLCFTIRKPVHVFGKEFVFPVPRIAVAQMVIARKGNTVGGIKLCHRGITSHILAHAVAKLQNCTHRLAGHSVQHSGGGMAAVRGRKGNGLAVEFGHGHSSPLIFFQYCAKACSFLLSPG